MIIIGTGGLAIEIWGLLKLMGKPIEGFVAKDQKEGEFCGLPILGDDEWALSQKGLSLIIANGNPKVRKSLIELYKDSYHQFFSFIHPSNVIMDTVTYRGGTIVMPLCVIMPKVKIGKFCHINMGCTIGHETEIGEGCIINHNAGISGKVKIGNNCLIGAGATILENLSIGNDAIVGAGAVVTKNVPDGETWIGIPAHKMSKGC